MYKHRNESPLAPTMSGYFWFKGTVNGMPVAQKVTILKYKDLEKFVAIGVEEGSILESFVGLWWGPIKEVAPWEATEVQPLTTIKELLNNQQENENRKEQRNIGLINRYDDAIDWVEKFIEKNLYLNDWDEDTDDNYALAHLIQDEVLFCNSIKLKDEWTTVLYVLCNDLFAWGMADAEPFGNDDIETLYKMHIADKRWGAQKWCCLHRRMQPQDPIKQMMIKDGVWDEAMEALPENFHSRAIRERNHHAS